MAELRDLDAIIPEDIEYRFRGEKYVLPGDIDVEHTYRILDLLQKATAIEEASLAAASAGKPVNFAKREENDKAIHQVLLELLQQRDPKLTALPVGVLGARQMLADALVVMGFEFVPVGDGRPPAKARNQSGRSSSSRASSRSSASRTKKS